MTFEEIEARFEFLVEKYGIDWSLKMDIAHSCAWGAEIRLTPQPNNPYGPDRSLVFFAGGGSTAEEAANEVAEDAFEWFEEWLQHERAKEAKQRAKRKRLSKVPS